MNNLKTYLRHYKKGEKRKWIIENLIPSREIIILYAPTNQYKTFLSLKIALEVATGSQELGATKIGSVFIYSTDTNPDDLITRIRGLTNTSYQSKKEDILKNLNLDFPENFDLTSEGYGSLSIETTEYDKDKDVLIGYGRNNDEIRVLRKWNRHWQYEDISETNRTNSVLIIIDTLSQSIGSNSINDDIAIRKAIKNLKSIINANHYEISILVIAHAGKNGSKGIMGSSLQKNDFPTVLKVRKRKNGQMELYREKIKCNAEGKSIPFKMRSTSIDDEETLYVDIGSSITEIESDIIDLYKDGLDKDNIRDNTYKKHGQHYNNKKSFNVVFGRKWNSLLEQGFLDSEQQDNN